jgi:osmotically-inducible protein OsmY
MTRHKLFPTQAALVAALLAAGVATPLLQGCGAFVVAGTTYGAAVVYDRRDEKTILDDETIEMQARVAHFQNPDIRKQSRLSVTSYNRKALITGQARSAEISDRYARLVSNLPDVRQVYNEAEIGPNISFTQISTDTYLTSRAKLAIQSIDLPGFDMLRVKVVTENGIVYLMGLVTPEESDATAEKVRRIPGVKGVVKLFEYIEPQRGPSQTQTQAGLSLGTA